MTSFLSFFLLCTKTHKFLYFKYLFFVFYGFLSEPRAGTERGSRGGGGGFSGGWLFLSETSLRVVGQQFL